MRRACCLTALLVVAAGLAACGPVRATRAPIADLAPGQRPAPGSDEAGLWMHMDRVEELVKVSSLLVRDPALDGYVHGVVCRLLGSQCESLRIYILRYAERYAGTAPNGMVLLGTGVFLRTASEAQLAFVLGHEIAHYRRRHSAQTWTEVKANAVPNFGANLALAISGLLEFSRAQEREADRLGFELMVKAGYAPGEAVRAWERWIAESATANASAKSTLQSTHPPDAERLALLRQLAAGAVAAAEPRIGRQDYAAAVRPLRHQLLVDEIRRRDFASSDLVLRRLIEDGDDGLGDIHFHLGELHRLRADVDDLPKALAEYRRALEHPDVPPEVLRSLGLVHLRLGDRTAARDALTRYLERRPDAEDRDIVKTQISELDRAR